jgi:peptidoglycan-associated lipoprotein
VVGDRVLFAVDQSTLSPAAMATLDQQASWLMSNPEYTALIEGHADEQGTREYNLALGARRASSVRDYLVAAGVPDGRLRTISYGKERPLEICSEESLLHAEPPRRDGHFRGPGGLIPCAVSAPSSSR